MNAAVKINDELFDVIKTSTTKSFILIDKFIWTHNFTEMRLIVFTIMVKDNLPNKAQRDGFRGFNIYIIFFLCKSLNI